jgi:hypothetical protein
MRHVVVCNVADERAVMGEAAQRVRRSPDRIVVLSPRRGFAFEADGILNIPMQFALEDAGSSIWPQKHRVRKAIALAGGLRSARFVKSVEDVLINIEACDPDVIHLRNLGSFGQWLEPKCSLRFPGRRVRTDPEAYVDDQDALR